MNFRISASSLAALEWSQIQSILKEYAQSSLGAESLAQISPGTLNREAAILQAEAVKELLQLKKEKELKAPLADYPDTLTILTRIDRSGELSVSEFAQLIQSLKVAQGLGFFLSKYKTVLPSFSHLLEGLENIQPWAAEHFYLIDARGEMVDSASTDLAALRALENELHEKIKNRLNDFLHNPRWAEVMQDFYITLREGRYVLPVRSNFKGRVGGIVHDVSHSESTVFVEPEEVVEWNNQLKLIEKEIQREIERILAVVVQNTKPWIPAFQKNLECIVKADRVSALALWVESWRSSKISVVQWRDSQGFQFEDLFHPLLASHSFVVSNSFTWGQGLVLSGPNTGGKTVLLKSIGLVLCLAAIGCPLPASLVILPIANNGVFVDIGDEQNLSLHLSTFSAHLKKIQEITRNMQEGDLVLMDEIATGTSPEEGQPLAQAVIEQFLNAKAFVFVTTHYGALKTFAMSDERCRVAAMAFDHKTRRPTYQICLDLPGESSALEAAEGIGLDPRIISRARELRAGVQEETLQKAVLRFETLQEESLKKIEEFSLREKKLEEIEKNFSIRVQEFEQRQREKLSDDLQEVLRSFHKIREELSEKVKKESTSGATHLKTFQELSAASDLVRAQLSELEEGRGLPQDVFLSEEELKLEDIVEVEDLGVGPLLELPKYKGEAKASYTVMIGTIKTKVPFAKLRKPSPQALKGYKAYKKSVSKMEQKRGGKEHGS